MSNITVGSICSGIEAASVAWKNLPFRFEWFSEISDFPSRLLKEKYPFTPNVGDMCSIPNKLKSCEIESPDMICGGTPCQAFSLAGWKKGLEDDRGNLTLKFVDIINQNDRNRHKVGKNSTIVLWENVEGVLRDKTNAFGCFIASLAGFDNDIPSIRWPSAGYVNGPTRNVAWRILDAKYFGLPQQRRRLYVIAGGKDFNPENILFEDGIIDKMAAKKSASLSFMKNGKKFEVFREYTDCLYSAYGTKWNGNAAAYNGSLFVVENSRLRRLTPLECERLMGFPDNYTDIGNAKPTSRYQGTGNSWAVPVINWIGSRICKSKESGSAIDLSDLSVMGSRIYSENSFAIYRADSNCLISKSGNQLRSSESPNEPIFGNIQSIIDVNAQENVFITPVGCRGILRRSEERGLSINARLKSVLQEISSEWSHAEIEQVSLRQKRGRFSSKAPSSPNEVLELSI